MTSRSVLITGTSSGIGRAAALALSDKGFEVIAGVRKEADGRELREVANGRIVPVRLDVTDPDGIAAAVAFVERHTGGAGLAGLVNNAGVGTPWPMELCPLNEFRWHLEVNVTGQLAVTQAFLPLLKRGPGRIVNMGSEGGRITLPFMGAVTASKHALVSVTDALRMELRPWGIHVALVEPGATKSDAPGKLIDAGRRAIDESFSPVGRADYGGTFGQAIERIAVGHDKQGSAPEVIAAAVVRAMTDRKPKTRYPAGGHARALTRLARILPDRALDTLFLRMLGMPREFGARSTVARVSAAR